MKKIIYTTYDVQSQAFIWNILFLFFIPLEMFVLNATVAIPRDFMCLLISPMSENFMKEPKGLDKFWNKVKRTKKSDKNKWNNNVNSLVAVKVWTI